MNFGRKHCFDHLPPSFSMPVPAPQAEVRFAASAACSLRVCNVTPHGKNPVSDREEGQEENERGLGQLRDFSKERVLPIRHGQNVYSRYSRCFYEQSRKQRRSERRRVSCPLALLSLLMLFGEGERSTNTCCLLPITAQYLSTIYHYRLVLESHCGLDDNALCVTLNTCGRPQRVEGKGDMISYRRCVHDTSTRDSENSSSLPTVSYIMALTAEVSRAARLPDQPHTHAAPTHHSDPTEVSRCTARSACSPPQAFSSPPIGAKAVVEDAIAVAART